MRTHPSAIEPLELRIAPATLTGQILTYTDSDGDKVAITFSNGTLAGGMFTFNTGSVNGDNATPQQLRLIELTGGVGFAGADITMKVTKAGGGDGLAAVGRINAGANDLGKVVLKGDLGGITVGTGTAGTPALELLSVASMGVYGAATQVSSDFFSTITGPLGALKVTGDVQDSVFRVVGNALGTIGTVTIGGSLIGGAGLRSGSIITTGDMGAVKIGRHLIGGAGDESGKIDAGGKLASLTIGGSIRGGSGDYDTFTDTNAVLHSGQVFAVGDIGAVKIARDVIAGPVLPSFPAIAFSAAIHSHGALGGVTVGGTLGSSLVGDTGVGAVKIGRDASASIISGGALTSLTVGGDSSLSVTATGAIGLVKVGRDLRGRIDAGTTLASVTVGGSLHGQPTLEPTIESGGQMGLVKFAGDVVGYLAIESGAGLGGVIVGGSFLADLSGSFPSTIKSVGDIGIFKVGRDASQTLLESTVGGLGSLSVGGRFFAGSVTLAGELGLGKFGALDSATVHAMGGIDTLQIVRDFTRGTLIANGALASLTIGGNSDGTITAGNTTKIVIKGSVSGSIQATGTVGSLTIGGDLDGAITATGDITALTIGGSFLSPALTSTLGLIQAGGRLGALKIGGNIVGPSLQAGDPTSINFALIEAGRIGSVAIGGSVFAGTDNSNMGTLTGIPMIHSQHEIGSVTIKGDLRGTVGIGGDVTPALILAANEVIGHTTDLAIGKVTIGGTVERAGIHAGVSVFPFMTGTNGNASIGAVKVGGDWIASNLTAGVRDVNGNSFGNADDDVVDAPPGAEADAIIAKIASITIGRTLAGTAVGTDQFGFVAQEIGKLKIGARTIALTPGNSNDSINLIFTNDVQLSEI